MALSAAEEAFVRVLFNNRTALAPMLDYLKSLEDMRGYRAAVRNKKALLRAGVITRDEYDAWLAGNPQPPAVTPPEGL